MALMGTSTPTSSELCVSSLCESWAVPGLSLTAGDSMIPAYHPTQFSTWDSPLAANPLSPSKQNLWKTGLLLLTKSARWSCDQWTQHGHLEGTTTAIIIIIREYTCFIRAGAAGKRREKNVLSFL